MVSLESLQQQINSLETRFKEWTENIKEIMRLHNETHAKQHELYSDNAKMHDAAIDEKVLQLTTAMANLQTTVALAMTRQESDSIEERVRYLEVKLSQIEGVDDQKEKHKALWVMILLTLLSAVFGLLSNVIGFIIQ